MRDASPAACNLTLNILQETSDKKANQQLTSRVHDSYDANMRLATSGSGNTVNYRNSSLKKSPF